MWLRLLPLLAALLATACDSTRVNDERNAAETSGSVAKAPLVDLTSNSTLAAVRTAFNARTGEPRFLALLSPT